MNQKISEILSRLEIFVGGLGKAILRELHSELEQLPQPCNARLAEADRRAGAAERELATCRDDLERINRVRDKMKDQWGVDSNVSFDMVWAEALELKQQAIAQQESADGRISDAQRIALIEYGDARESKDSERIAKAFVSALFISPAGRQPLTTQEVREWWASENGLEDCKMSSLNDFEQVVRAVEARLGIKESA